MVGSRQVVQDGTLPGEQYLSADFNAVLTPPVQHAFQKDIRLNSCYYGIMLVRPIQTVCSNSSS